MRCDHQQIPAPGPPGRLRGGLPGPPRARHMFSPKKFTQPQLLACLVLKEFLRLDYRGLAAHLADHPDLARLIGLKAVPHYTTFQKAAAAAAEGGPGPPDLRRRARAGPAGQGPQAAGPAGGRRRHRDGVAARQPVLRRSAGPRPEPARRRRLTPSTRRSSSWPTATATWCWRRSPAAGPASDLVQFGRALEAGGRPARIGTLLADADFDAEWVHEQVRSYGIRTIIPPERGRPSDKPPAGSGGGG